MKLTTNRRAAIANTRLIVIVGALFVLILVAWAMWPSSKKSDKAGKADKEHVSKKHKKGGGKKQKAAKKQEAKLEAAKLESEKKSEPAADK
jgi:FtsZ-interacting cell division protein ZipA